MSFTPSSVGVSSEVAMNFLNDTDIKDDQQIWSSWTMHSTKWSQSMTNYVSAFVFTLAAVVVMAGNVT